jgi:signal transduction histidine kinase
MERKGMVILGLILIIGAIILSYFMGANQEIKFWAGLVTGGICFLFLWLFLSIRLVTIEGDFELTEKMKTFSKTAGILLLIFWGFVAGMILVNVGGIITIIPSICYQIWRTGTVIGMVTVIAVMMTAGIMVLRKAITDY